MPQDNLIELYPDSDRNCPPRSYYVRTTRTSPETSDYDQQRADADQQAQPDDFYYQAAGQEPEPVERGSFFKGCLNAIWMSVVLWGLLAFVAPPLVGWVVRMMGA